MPLAVPLPWYAIRVPCQFSPKQPSVKQSLEGVQNSHKQHYLSHGSLTFPANKVPLSKALQTLKVAILHACTVQMARQSFEVGIERVR